MENGKINFLKRYEAVQKDRNRLTPGAKRELILVMVVILLACIGSGLLIYKNVSLRNQIDANNAYLNDPVNLEHYNEVLDKDNHIALLNGAIRDIDNIKEMAETFPDFNTTFVNTIYGSDKANVRSFTYDVNNLSIKAESDALNQAPLYVDYLQSTGLFESVIYNGFGYNVGTGKYDFTVYCTILRGAE